MKMNAYHGNFICDFGEESMVARPFAFVGLGATQYGDAMFTAMIVPGNTRFSFALGGGVKVRHGRQHEVLEQFELSGGVTVRF